MRDTEGWLFAEDSGLEVDALGGEPGVYSARFAGPKPRTTTTTGKLLRVLAENPIRTARYVCAIALVRGGVLIRTFRGTVEGEILREPPGTGGFGYDPLFYYPPFGCSFGETTREQKQSVSHRGKALEALLAFIAAQQRGE